jgi:hypothetical protein
VVLVNFVRVQLVQQALPHQGAGIVLSVNPVALTGNVVVNAATNVGHVRALCNIITHHACSESHASWHRAASGDNAGETCISRGPNEHVVSKVTRDLPRRSLVGNEALAQQSNVLVVPSIAISDADALGDAVELITVVPPRHGYSVTKKHAHTIAHLVKRT